MAKENMAETVDTAVFELEVGHKDDKGIHKEVEIREIMGVDEEAINKAEVRGNVGKLITTLLASVVVRIGDLTPKDVKSRSKWENIFKKLPMGDRDKIMLEVRKFSHGNEMELDMKCPSCKAKIKHIVEIDNDIEVRELEEDAQSIPFTLPKGLMNSQGQLCTTGTLRLPNGDDQEVLDSIARKNAGQANTSLLSRVVNELDGYGKLGLSDLRKMSVRDREYLIKLVGESQYGPKYEISFPCPACGDDIEAGVHPVNFL